MLVAETLILFMNKSSEKRCAILTGDFIDNNCKHFEKKECGQRRVWGA